MKMWWEKDLRGVIEEKKLLNEKQYARRKMTTIANIISRTLTFSYHLIKGEEFAHIDYDAKNCFDRVVPEVAALAANRMGMNCVNTNFMTQVFHNFKHFLVIKQQRSTTFYSDSPLLRILGVGQGMGWSPMLWNLVNDVILTVMERQVPGEVYISL